MPSPPPVSASPEKSSVAFASLCPSYLQHYTSMPHLAHVRTVPQMRAPGAPPPQDQSHGFAQRGRMVAPSPPAPQNQRPASSSDASPTQVSLAQSRPQPVEHGAASASVASAAGPKAVQRQPPAGRGPENGSTNRRGQRAVHRKRGISGEGPSVPEAPNGASAAATNSFQLMPKDANSHVLMEQVEVD
jgi:hypothetical protein